MVNIGNRYVVLNDKYLSSDFKIQLKNIHFFFLYLLLSL